jgi:Tfp pilus assembly protein PilF
MLLSAILLAAAVTPAPQEPAAQPATAPAVSSGAAQSAIDAGLAAFRRRRFAQAEVDFRKAMEAEPASAAPAFYLAYTYYKMAEPKRPFHPDKQKAKELFAKAYELDPTFRPVWGSGTVARPRK